MRIPVTRMETQIEDDQTLLTKWDEIQTKTNALKEVTSQLSSFTTWNQKSATSSDTSVMTASATTSAVTGEYSIDITSLATAEKYWGTTQSESALGLSGSFTINGQVISVATDYTLSDIARSINSVSGDMTKKVSAYIVNNVMFLKNADTGVSNTMSITDTDGILGGTGGLGFDLSKATNYTAGTDLAGTVENIAVSSASNTGITSFISGVTLNFTDDTTILGPVKLTVENDTDTIKSLLQDFVDAYNDLNDYMSAVQSVTLNTAGTSVSSAGYLQGDLVANTLENRVRSLTSASITKSGYINSDYSSLRQIGIYVKSDTNKLAIGDSDALDEALSNHFQDVQNMFRMTDPGTGEVVGVMKNLDSYLGNVLDPVQGPIYQRQTDLNADISDKQTRVYNLNMQLQGEETALYEHFAATESITSFWTSQLSYLQKALGS